MASNVDFPFKVVTKSFFKNKFISAKEGGQFREKYEVDHHREEGWEVRNHAGGTQTSGVWKSCGRPQIHAR